MSSSDDEEFHSASEGEQSEEDVKQPITQKSTKESEEKTPDRPSAYSSLESENFESPITEESTKESKEKTPDLPLKADDSIESENLKPQIIKKSTKESEEKTPDPPSTYSSLESGNVEPPITEESTKESKERTPDLPLKADDSIESENLDPPITKQLTKESGKQTNDLPPTADSSLESGWDDWGEESSPSEQQVDASEGWNDWSLIDEKKVKETVPSSFNCQNPLDKLVEADKKKSGWGWGGLVSAVGETFTSTIESSFGLPSAEEVARRVAQKEDKSEELEQRTTEENPQKDSAAPQLGFGMLSGLVSGGIDVLESIGKKTFEAVTVKDENAGGRRRIFFAENSGQNLSDVLRELKDRQERCAATSSFNSSYASKPPLPDVASEFGKSEGMAHLEALEMLSSSRPKANPKFERQFFEALSNCDTESSEDGDFENLLNNILKRINLPYEPKNLLSCDNEIGNRLTWVDGKSAEELFSDSVQSLVDFTASSVQLVSKLSNLLLILRQDVNYQDFVQLFTLLAQRVNFITNQYTDTLPMSEESATIDDLITQVHVECSTAIDFLRQAHRLLSPMLQNL